ncbi:hypothetical protein J1614_007513 [Plenodomus biglobosus]|nr:hypothetical protein J1614_007513 [Plenodomus biglobosus]
MTKSHTRAHTTHPIPASTGDQKARVPDILEALVPVSMSRQLHNRRRPKETTGTSPRRSFRMVRDPRHMTACS